MSVTFTEDKYIPCYMCGDIIEELVVKIFSERANVLMLDMLCFEQLTAIGIKSIYNITPGSKES